jgi:hypothetical protein
MRYLIIMLFPVLFISSCKKKTEPKIIFKFQFDPTQPRLNAFGQPAGMAAGHAGQNPSFNSITAHYIEMTTGALTPLGGGAVLYHADETTAGGSTAIDFNKSKFSGSNQSFFEMPLKNLAAGDYEFLRVSLAYQNYDVSMYFDTTVSGIHIQQDLPCTIASFIGYNTYVTNYKIKNQNVTVNTNKTQGYWGFESSGNISGYPYNFVQTGQAPAGSTTVVNPLFATSPIPAGSCVVTAAFDGGKLKITGNETEDVIVNVTLSNNKSFEWVEVVNDGKWEPAKGEFVVDMGVRGMKVSAQ